ncbi:DUF3320 domain-containing protein [Streptomyces erythrochromogenes]|uniref:DUF3320 domain-containing protein n=1 Tax=Streptomyces erythrochromogenes TaxID=285574 RepID=UPI00342F60BD
MGNRVTARFKGQYRADREAATALTVTGTWDKHLPGRLAQALAWQQGHARTLRLAEEHRALLGPYLPGGVDGFAALDEALANAARIAELAAESNAPGAVADRLGHGAHTDHGYVGLQVQAVRGSLADWCDAVDLRMERWTETSSRLASMFEDARRLKLLPALGGTLDEADRALGVLAADPSGPGEWQTYRRALSVLTDRGLDDLVSRATERGIGADAFPEVVERALLQLWADTLLAADGRLRTERAAELDARVRSFREADRMLVDAASGAVIESCNSRKPKAFGAGGASLIRREAEKKTRHMAVRELLGKAREVVQAVKPCFMMNPLSVSQYLPADYRFDVVIFDEASQVRPGDAVNCVYRGHSLVVAGDEKQLPPTSFFDSTVGDESDEYDEGVPDAFESLLHACKAGAMRELPLRWHYRSRHEDLITFSNRSFYGNGMVTFPGAAERGPDIGVEFFKADGCYDKGRRRDNRREAEAVAQRVLHHFDTRPGRSLGVVALSQAQATAIDECVQQARLARPDLDHCFTEDRLAGFFVKNLESVQGDERDVMIMSLGYGPDERGVLGLNFGPINREGGWRRLNVAVTRARFRVEVVASFHGSQLKDGPNESVQHLKRYLEYAETGPAVLARDTVVADAEPDSPFEESVLAVLRDWGYQVQPQVGVAGYRVDLGLRHPAAQGSFALGIECDGAMYHSSRAARDRDRLRQQVLEDLGWTLHRIWGTDWYRNRPEAERRLKEAVETAVTTDPFARPEAVRLPDGGAPATHVTPAETRSQGPRPEPERILLVDRAPVREWSTRYVLAEVGIDTWAAPEFHTPEARPLLRKVLAQIIEAEGPIHQDLLVQRAREVWGLGKSGRRMVENAQHVLDALVRAGIAECESGFVDVAGRRLRGVRTPLDDQPRRIAHVSPAERQLAMRELALECPGMTTEELLQQARELFGWKRMGSDIRSALESDVRNLLARGELTGAPDRLIATR